MASQTKKDTQFSSGGTETALLKILDDTYLHIVDPGKAVGLTLLDLFSAFDMTDHSFLPDCL